jgi:DNA-binding NtrC family response regulator
MPGRVLIVEPDHSDMVSLLEAVCSVVDTADTCSRFDMARQCLLLNEYERVFTNLRLHAHNGLHLVYVAQSRSPRTRSVVYTERLEPSLAQEVQSSGAFYEVRERLQHTVRGYLQAASLPPGDRRQLSGASRRAAYRGGRRCWDDWSKSLA